MHITSLSVSHLGPLKSMSFPEVPPTGVTIIHGDNEQGKSSIMQAVKMALTEKSSAKKGWVKALATAGLSEPIGIRLGLHLDGVDTVVEKNYLKQVRTQLSFPGSARASLSGDEAENELNQLLSSSVDTNLARELFIEQGTIDTQVDALSIPAVQQALGGTDNQPGTGESDLVEKVRNEAKEFLTTSGARKKFINDAVDTTNAAKERLAAVEKKISEMDATVASISRLRKTIEELNAALPALKEDLATWEERKEKLADLQGAVNEARAGAEVARRESDVLKQILERRKREIAEAEERKHDLAGEEKLQQELTSKAREIEKRIEEAEKRKTETLELAKAACATLRAAERRQERQRLVKEKEECGQVIEKALVLKEEIASKRATLSTTEVTTAVLRKLEKAEKDVEVARATREAAVATVTLHKDTSEVLTVRVDDDDIELDATDVPLLVASTRTIGYRGLLATITPAQGADKLNGDVDKAVSTLEQLLEDVGCDSVTAAREVHDRDTETKRDIEKLELRRDELLGTHTLEERTERVAEIERALDEFPPDEEFADATNVASAETEEVRLEELRENADEAQRSAEVAASEATALQGSTVLVDVKVQASVVEKAKADCERSSARVREAEEAQPLEELKKQAAAAASTAYEAEQFATKKAAELAEEQPDLIDSRLQVARTKVESNINSCQEARLQLASKSSMIDGARGLAEERDAAEAEAKEAAEKSTRLVRRADVYARLLSVLEKHKKEAFDAYAAPLTQAINDLARVIFGPRVHFSLNEDLKLSQRIEDGIAIDVEQLSGGAKEQLTLIVRLALAEVAAKSGAQVPIFIDDFLGHSDQGRIDDMAALINMISARHQIFILTCFPSRFAGVANAHSYRIDELTG